MHAVMHPMVADLASSSERQFLRRCAKVGAQALLSGGYEYLFATAIPLMRRIARLARRPGDRRLAAGALAIVGNLFVYLHAPRAALRYYRLATRVDAQLCEARCGAALLLYMLGDYKRGSAAHAHARRFCKTDRICLDELEDVREIVHYERQLFYEPRDITVAVAESLARNAPAEAVEIVKGKRSPGTRIWRARAFAASGATERMIREWKMVLPAIGYLSSADWFYLCDRDWNEPKIWTVLLELTGELRNVGLFFRQLSTTEAKRSRVRRAEAQEDILRYHLARCTIDMVELRRLHNKYPSWREPRQILHRLLTGGPRPALSVSEKGLARIAHPA